MYIPVWIRHIGSDKHHSKGKVCFDVPPGDEKPIFPKWGLSLPIGPPAGPLGYSLAGVFPSCLLSVCVCVAACLCCCPHGAVRGAALLHIAKTMECGCAQLRAQCCAADGSSEN